MVPLFADSNLPADARTFSRLPKLLRDNPVRPGDYGYLMQRPELL